MDLITPGIGLIFWQTVTFLVVLFVLGKFVWKPIMTAIKSREDSIEEALAEAEKARSEMAALSSENENLLKQAREERDSILKEAKTAATQMITEAKDKASVEAKALVEKAKESIEGERRAAVADIRNQAATLSVEIAEKLLRRELSNKKAQEELLAEYVKESDLTTA